MGRRIAARRSNIWSVHSKWRHVRRCVGYPLVSASAPSPILLTAQNLSPLLDAMQPEQQRTLIESVNLYDVLLLRTKEGGKSYTVKLFSLRCVGSLVTAQHAVPQ